MAVLQARIETEMEISIISGFLVKWTNLTRILINKYTGITLAWV